MRELVVQRIPIIASSTVVFTVYEKTVFDLDARGGHSTITTFDGHEGWYGRLGTRRLSDEINAIPVGEKRFEAVDGWQRAQHQEAYEAILAVYPGLKNDPTASYHSGEVSINSGRRNGSDNSPEFRVVDACGMIPRVPSRDEEALKSREADA